MIPPVDVEISPRRPQSPGSANLGRTGLFILVREREHIAMLRQNPDGTRTPLTLPNHAKIKGSTLRLILRQSNITREDFLKAYERA